MAHNAIQFYLILTSFISSDLQTTDHRVGIYTSISNTAYSIIPLRYNIDRLINDNERPLNYRPKHMEDGEVAF